MSAATDQAMMRAHHAAVDELQRAYQAIPPDVPVRLVKPTSNLFRFREPVPPRAGANRTGAGRTRAGRTKAGRTRTGRTRNRSQGTAPQVTGGLDGAPFSRVINVDAEAKTAVAGGMTTYEDLADATLRHGLMPLVVPELKTITLGGAVTGLGVESTSLRNGLPHESVLAMEILTGDGRVVTATETNEHAALYRGFPNSYGTLGYALSLTIELEPVQPFVHLRHFRFANAEACMAAIGEIAATGSYQGHRADFLDGTVFGQGEMYLTVGAFSGTAPWRSDYTGQHIYYQSIRGPREDFLSVHDYLWRWDTDWFWCSRAFGVQRPLIRALWPKHYRRSDTYRKLVAFDRARGVTSALDRRRGRPAREMVIQDVEIPLAGVPEFLRFFAQNVGMSPVWLCPLRLRSARAWPLYPLRPGEVYVNVGFWGTAVLPPGRSDGYHNRMIEEKVAELGGHKGLYSTSFYSEDEFWEHYNGTAYAALKQEYDGGGRLAGLYEKCVQRPSRSASQAGVAGR